MKYIIVLTIIINGCSTFSDNQNPAKIWKVDQNLGESALLSFIGSLDSSHFYAARQTLGSTGRSLTAYDRSDGRIVWSSTMTPVQALVTAGGRVFAPGHLLNAFDASTGRSLWTLMPDSSLSLVQGTADASRVFAGSLYSTYAVDAATGTLLWKRSFSGPWEETRNRTLALTPEGDLLVAFDALPVPGGVKSLAVVVAVDPTTGTERWRFVDGDATSERSPRGLTLFGDLVLYSDSFANEAVAFSRTTRRVVWRARWTPGYLGPSRAPVVADGVAYFSDGDGRLFAVDAATGARRWSVQHRRGFTSNHEVCGPLFLANNGPVQVVGRDAGDDRGSLFPDNETALMSAVDGDQAFFSTTKGVYAFDCDG